jgi:hypothetical protein
MNAARLLRLALDPTQILAAQGMQADPWQRDFLLGTDRQVLLNCCRQAGKSTVTAALALHTALFRPRSLVLLLAPTHRQSLELFRKVLAAYDAIGRPIGAIADAPSTGRLELASGSRVVALPGKGGTIRGYSRVTLLLIDEAAQVSDELYRAVRPMLAVSQGRLVCLSTPFGQRGFFFEEWHSEGPWRRVSISCRECPRITEEFVHEEERALGREWVDQEYRCQFTSVAGLVYPEFGGSLIDDWPRPEGRAVGGIDWGFRNPFAAVWGILDREDVLWIGWERYGRNQTLEEHLQAIHETMTGNPSCPRREQTIWYADPSGPEWIERCLRLGWKVTKGDNDIHLGIAAVTERLRTGRLKVMRARCPNLVAESRLYRYPTPAERAVAGENPIDANNHALGALRYLVSQIDSLYLARRRFGSPGPGDSRKPPDDPMRNEPLWTPR